ncbi:uncharacterized protein LOC111810200 isoform X1 [Cucurbita pepo subsp. pepo]|uniref:uncharacterized protein LOC111810200 isoform X1 n=1 Tax=Cucurbita pepo subsp. pepo TaxID=3664 RepID=UPI000C9D352C|nr:uncharacterized protein LOC111810200 isoform X1 [Cucurbita pepo subsp. pepo]
MERGGEGAATGTTAAATAASSSQTSRPGRRVDPLLVTCRFFSVVTALTAILCIVSNVVAAIRSFKNKSDIFDGIFRCYAVVIAFFVVLAETEWEFILKNWKVLEYWAGRGMLQIFVAVMTRAFPAYSVEQREFILLQEAASYLLLACGAVYVVSFFPRISREYCALGFSNVLVKRRRLQRTGSSKIFRSWKDKSKNLNSCSFQTLCETI